MNFIEFLFDFLIEIDIFYFENKSNRLELRFDNETQLNKYGFFKNDKGVK